MSLTKGYFPTKPYMKIYDLFWQYPVITEKIFYEQNKKYKNYIGIPWATILDKNIPMQQLFNTIKQHIIMHNNFTCCQHIYFKKLIPLMQLLGIKILYTPHKLKNENKILDIEIRSCPLYAVNIEDSTRNALFSKMTNKDFINAKREYIYSFQGGFNNNYLTNIRPNIFAMKHPENTYIKNTGGWHFENMVYNEKQNSKGELHISDDCKKNNKSYNEILLHSRYSLCPSGSGPSSIRFWEALAVGSIPILLSDTLDLPIYTKHGGWQEAILQINEKDVEKLPEILNEISSEKEANMRALCLKAYEYFKYNYAGKLDSSDVCELGDIDIIHYCCNTIYNGDCGGVARYDYQLSQVFKHRKFFKGPQEKNKMLYYLKTAKNPIIITDNHLACDIPNNYKVVLVHHGCAIITATRNPDWGEPWKSLCCDGQNKMLTYRNENTTKIISISQSCTDDFTKHYKNDYLKFEKTLLLHSSELNETKYKTCYNKNPIVLGNWHGLKKGEKIIPHLIKSIPNFTFQQLNVKLDHNGIDYFNKKKQEIYLNSDIFLQISNSEGNSYATLDALLCGLTVVSSNVGLFYKDVPEDCFVKIDWERNHDSAYIQDRLKYAWENKETIGRNGREWYLNNCCFADWKKNMKNIIQNFHSKPLYNKKCTNELQLTIKKSNVCIKQLLSQKEPFLITRLGIGHEATIVYLYNKQNISYDNVPLQILHTLSNNAGIYNVTKENYKEYCSLCTEAIKRSAYLAAFQNTNTNINNIQVIQSYFTDKFKLNNVHSRILEPFYCILENDIPWSHCLKNKKILIVHPFIDSIKIQLKNNFRMFKDKHIFLPEQQFTFYKTYQTLAGNHIHSSWKETYDIMCNDIKKLDFDIALLGCGGYGLPLCNYIYTNMKKSAIYVGGGLQLLFGVMGKRWENNEMWKKIIKENNTIFIKPSGDEIICNKKLVENACYW